MRIVKSYHIEQQLGKESNQNWTKKMLNGLSAKLKDEAHYISKEKKLTALSKEVESLLEFGWWVRHEMLKTNKYSLHKERRKGINGLECAKFIKTHLLEWQKRVENGLKLPESHW